MIRTITAEKSVKLEDPAFFYGIVPINVEIPETLAKEILSRYQVPSLPSGAEIKPFDDFSDGQQVRDYLVLVDQVEVKPSAKDPFLSFRCTNSQGSFYGKKWGKQGESTEEVKQFLLDNPIQKVSGKVQEYPKGSGKNSFIMERFITATDNLNPLSLLPATTDHFEDLTLEFFSYLYALEEPYRSLALGLFDKCWAEFSLKAAATSQHHNYMGGLLQHTTELIRIDRHIFSMENEEKDFSSLVLQLVKRHLIDSMENRRKEKPTDYKWLPWSGDFDHLMECLYSYQTTLSDRDLNQDLVVFSHAIHDVGKIFEYSNFGETDKYALLFPYEEKREAGTETKGAIGRDPFGGIIGHIPAGLLLLQTHMLEADIALKREEISHIFNILLSHHAKGEWGSPATPASPEAWLVHIVDFIDSRYAKQVK